MKPLHTPANERERKAGVGSVTLALDGRLTNYRPRDGTSAPVKTAAAPVKAATPAMPPPAEPKPGEEYGRALYPWDVDSAAVALVKELLPQFVADLNLPTAPRIQWYRWERPDERAMRRLGVPPYKTCALPIGAPAAVLPTDPSTIWLHADIAPDRLPEIVAHEARHCWQMARYGPEAVVRQRDQCEADAGEYGAAAAAWWRQQRP